MAWVADGGGGDASPPADRLTSCWLATSGAPPGRLPSRAARAAASRASGVAAHRALALRAVPARRGGGGGGQGPLAGVLVATSGGRVDWVVLGGEGGEAEEEKGDETEAGSPAPSPPPPLPALLGAAPPTRLSTRPSPALSLAVADVWADADGESTLPSPPLPLGAGWVAVAGHADGCLQAWCLGRAGTAPAGAAPADAPAAAAAAPADLVLERVHQSGITALDLAVVDCDAAAGEARLACVSGGDDQALTLTWLRAAWGGGARPSPTTTPSLTATGASIFLPTAHASAIRGLWAGRWGGGGDRGAGRLGVVSVCLEQAVRVWRLEEGEDSGDGAAAAPPTLVEEGGPPGRVQVQCPENLAGLADGGRLLVAVVGRGMEALAASLDDER